MPLLKQEVYCHACNGYVQFEIDIDQDGSYTIPCPRCGHKHYRVVQNRRITDQRWASSGGSYIVTWATYSGTSTDTSNSTGGSYYYYDSAGCVTTAAY